MVPKLEFNDEDPTEMVSAYIVGKMIFHDDIWKAYSFFARYWLVRDRSLREAPGHELINLPADIIKALLLGPSINELENEKKTRIRKGYTAGVVILIMRLCDELGKPMSLSRAVRVLERARASASFTIAGIELYCSRPEILDSWRSMRPVAHLFAANAAVDDLTRQGHIPPSAATMSTLMTVAASILEWATFKRFDDRGKSAPVMDKDVAWSLPDRYQPQDLGMVNRSQLPKWLLSAIEHYSSIGHEPVPVGALPYQ